MKKNNILIVHPIKEFSGSLKSIEEYVKLLKNKYEFIFLTPKGLSSKRLSKFGRVIQVWGLSKFDNSQLGYYKNLRWLLIIREVVFLFPTILAALYIKFKFKKLSIIHFNEITLIPTIYIFKFFFQIPFVLHCRILFKKNNYFGKKIIKFINKNVKKVIVIDNDVKESFPKSFKTEIVRNIFIKKNFLKLKKNSEYLNLGYLGSFLKYKGLEDLIKVTNNLNKKNYKIRLFLAGNFVRKNFIIEKLNLSNNISEKILINKNIILLGHLNNLKNFYQKIDILCFPSYLNALGRQVFEAGIYSIPSIVCIKKNSDSFINYRTGLSFKNPGSLKTLEKKIIFFYNQRHKIKKMGNEARKLMIKNYDINENKIKLNKIYQRLI